MVLMAWTLALIQMRVDGGEKQRNLARAETRLTEAAANGVQIALLPEALDLGWTHPSAREQAEPVPGGEPCRRLTEAARRHHLWICAGLTERAERRIFNTAVLIDPTGNVVLRHRKLNELTIGHPYYDQGDRLGVACSPIGNLGLMICADAFARDRVLSRALCYMGADLILSPCAWAVPADHDNVTTPYGQLWHDSYMPVAREFQVWIAACSNVGQLTAGPWAGRKCIGSSMVIDPAGKEMARAPFGEAAEVVLYADITPVDRPTRGCGWDELKR
jgi:predicted amidohydrolase